MILIVSETTDERRVDFDAKQLELDLAQSEPNFDARRVITELTPLVFDESFKRIHEAYSSALGEDKEYSDDFEFDSYEEPRTPRVVLTRSVFAGLLSNQNIAQFHSNSMQDGNFFRIKVGADPRELASCYRLAVENLNEHFMRMGIEAPNSSTQLTVDELVEHETEHRRAAEALGYHSTFFVGYFLDPKFYIPSVGVECLSAPRETIFDYKKLIKDRQIIIKAVSSMSDGDIASLQNAHQLLTMGINGRIIHLSDYKDLVIPQNNWAARILSECEDPDNMAMFTN